MPFEKGIYSKTATNQTYDTMFFLAKKEVINGNSVVLDATFSFEKYRNQAVLLAKQLHADILFVECVVPDALLKQRLIMRNNRDTVSDARIFHFQSFKTGFEPITEIEEDRHLKVNTGASMDACLSQILPRLCLKKIDGLKQQA